MTVRWAGAANRDLNAIWEYLNNESPRGAASMMRRIRAVTKMLGERQHAGRPGRAPGTRELVVTRTPYLLIYEINDDGPLILHVRHGRQEWPPA